jgi:alkylhydroperoxidase family enzyme
VSRIDVPGGRDPLLHLWGGTGNKLTGPAAAFSDAVYRKSTLPLREFEAARITIARVNDCSICLSLVQLGLCVGAWLAFGRLNRVFGVDEACRIPLAPHGPDRLHHVPQV